MSMFPLLTSRANTIGADEEIENLRLRRSQLNAELAERAAHGLLGAAQAGLGYLDNRAQAEESAQRGATDRQHDLALLRERARLSQLGRTPQGPGNVVVPNKRTGGPFDIKSIQYGSRRQPDGPRAPSDEDLIPTSVSGAGLSGLTASAIPIMSKPQLAQAKAAAPGLASRVNDETQRQRFRLAEEVEGPLSLVEEARARDEAFGALAKSPALGGIHPEAGEAMVRAEAEKSARVERGEERKDYALTLKEMSKKAERPAPAHVIARLRSEEDTLKRFGRVGSIAKELSADDWKAVAALEQLAIETGLPPSATMGLSQMVGGGGGLLVASGQYSEGGSASIGGYDVGEAKTAELARLVSKLPPKARDLVLSTWALNKEKAKQIEGGRMTDADQKFYERILINPLAGPSMFATRFNALAGESLDSYTRGLEDGAHLGSIPTRHFDNAAKWETDQTFRLDLDDVGPVRQVNPEIRPKTFRPELPHKAPRVVPDVPNVIESKPGTEDRKAAVKINAAQNAAEIIPEAGRRAAKAWDELPGDVRATFDEAFDRLHNLRADEEPEVPGEERDPDLEPRGGSRRSRARGRR